MPQNTRTSLRRELHPAPRQPASTTFSAPLQPLLASRSFVLMNLCGTPDISQRSWSPGASGQWASLDEPAPPRGRFATFPNEFLPFKVAGWRHRRRMSTSAPRRYIKAGLYLLNPLHRLSPMVLGHTGSRSRHPGRPRLRRREHAPPPAAHHVNQGYFPPHAQRSASASPSPSSSCAGAAFKCGLSRPCRLWRRGPSARAMGGLGG